MDVTDIDPSLANEGFFTGIAEPFFCLIAQSSHDWPIMFYTNSIMNEPSDYNGFGFRLSAEAGNLETAISQYPVDTLTNLGTTLSACTESLGYNPPTPITHVDFSSSPVAGKSTTGTVIQNAGEMTLITGSPVWLSIVPTNTTPVDSISFYANFSSSGTGAAGLLTVYWDNNAIGTVDERIVGEGVSYYTLPFPVTETNSTHILSFRLDPFSGVQSTVILTNVVLSEVGVSQPFTISVTTNFVNGSRIYQLTGQAGFDYGLQMSTNLIDWTQIAVLENTNGAVTFYDPGSTNSPCRFYRAVAPY